MDETRFTEFPALSVDRKVGDVSVSIEIRRPIIFLPIIGKNPSLFNNISTSSLFFF